MNIIVAFFSEVSLPDGRCTTGKTRLSSSRDMAAVRSEFESSDNLKVVGVAGSTTTDLSFGALAINVNAVSTIDVMPHAAGNNGCHGASIRISVLPVDDATSPCIKTENHRADDQGSARPSLLP